VPETVTKTLRLVTGDQLSRSISSLRDIDVGEDIVLMLELREEATYVPHHKQKIVLILAAMRHFAEQLRGEGIAVDYVRLDDEGNSGTFSTEIERAVQRHDVKRLVVTEAAEWRVLDAMQTWQKRVGIDVEIRDDDRFLISRTGFADWARGRSSLRMEHFYRVMRRRTGWLMDGEQPAGGRWNYDRDNRRPLPDDRAPPHACAFIPDTVTREVMDLVEHRFSHHFGDLASFSWAVTRADALEALRHFIAHALPCFGDFQDAMKTGEDFLYHSLLSPYLNIGLLEPREVCEAALEACEGGNAPLNAVEGFIRQILGWREYIRGIYWLKMPGYADGNFLDAVRPLPAFYWTGHTDLHCLHEAIDATRQHAYAHHIQRLMLTGNFALLAGIEPAQVEAWYLAVYADAFEWVELPNTHGMALYADGGLMSTKPYAASGAYIKRMSDYCRGCRYDPGARLGDNACPFNHLYWNFLIENEQRLKANPRMAIAYRNLARMTHEMRQQIVHQAQHFLSQIDARRD
jgi:deoxyribodipyrimidine photolyase-related protein